jgi:hypothetical protein
MPTKFTPEHLIASLYNETDSQIHQELLSELKNDAALADEFSDLSEVIGMLDDAGLDPHPSSVAIIMEYSAKTHEVHA